MATRKRGTQRRKAPPRRRPVAEAPIDRAALELARRIAKAIGIPLGVPRARGVDLFLPFLDQMRREGATVELRFDGAGEDARYSVQVALPDVVPRIGVSRPRLTEALAEAVDQYAKAFWRP